MADDKASWKNVYKRINAKRKEAGITWTQLSTQAHIRLASWMTGVIWNHPTDSELNKIAPVLNTTYDYLRYGIESTESE